MCRLLPGKSTTDCKDAWRPRYLERNAYPASVLNDCIHWSAEKCCGLNEIAIRFERRTHETARRAFIGISSGNCLRSAFMRFGRLENYDDANCAPRRAGVTGSRDHFRSVRKRWPASDGEGNASKSIDAPSACVGAKIHWRGRGGGVKRSRNLRIARIGLQRRRRDANDDERETNRKGISRLEAYRRRLELVPICDQKALERI